MLKNFIQVWIIISSVLFLPINSVNNKNKSIISNEIKNTISAKESEEYFELVDEYDLRETNVYHRVYLDSSGDILESKNNNIDYNLGYQSKNQWYYINLEVAAFYFSDYYVTTKQELINKIGNTFKINYKYSFNFWDSKIKWKYPNGKESSYKTSSASLTLTTFNNQKTIESDSGKKSKEKGKIKLISNWSDEGLKISIKLGVWYTWAWGSIYDHASLTKIQLNSISSGNSALKIDSAIMPVQTTISMSGTKYLYLTDLFNSARTIYFLSLVNEWEQLNLISAAYNVAGPISCTNGYGYGYINIFHFKPFFNDIKNTLKKGQNGSGKFKLIFSNTGLFLNINLYYVSTSNNLTYISQTSTRRYNACKISYVGLSSFTYSYKESN